MVPFGLRLSKIVEALGRIEHGVDEAVVAERRLPHRRDIVRRLQDGEDVVRVRRRRGCDHGALEDEVVEEHVPQADDVVDWCAELRWSDHHPRACP